MFNLIFYRVGHFQKFYIQYFCICVIFNIVSLCLNKMGSFGKLRDQWPFGPFYNKHNFILLTLTRLRILRIIAVFDRFPSPSYPQRCLIFNHWGDWPINCFLLCVDKSSKHRNNFNLSIDSFMYIIIQFCFQLHIYIEKLKHLVQVPTSCILSELPKTKR